MPHRPTKTVRFAYENTIYYPAPAIALSSSTATPPTPTSSLPIQRSSKLHHVAHIQTQYPHRYFLSSGISWDLRDRPSSITRYHHHLSPHALSEPATSPPTDFMRIVAPTLPWSIKVYPAAHGAYVTVGDVLDSIYIALRTNVRSTEFAQLSSSKDQASASVAYQERYRRLHGSPKHYDEEKRAGMKRVDFLLGRTHFVELVASTHHPDQWTLVVSK